MRRIGRHVLPVLILGVALTILLNACSRSADVPVDHETTGSTTSGQTLETQPRTEHEENADVGDQQSVENKPDGFPLPVYADWTLAASREESKAQIYIFRFEGDRDKVLQGYAQDLTDLGLDVTVEGFRIIANGVLDNQPIRAQIAFQRAEELVQATFSIQ